MNPDLRTGSTLRAVLVGLVAVLALRVVVMLTSAGAGLYVDEAQYWDWSRDLQWGYWSKPPGVAALIAASTALLGDGLLGVRFLAMLCWPLTALVLWWLGRRMGGADAGLWAAALFVGTPAAGVLGLVVSTDGPLMLLWASAMAATWCATQAQGRHAWMAWALAGAACGAGMLTKYTMGAIAVGWALVVLWDRRHLPGTVLAAAVAAALFAPNLWWNAQHHWPTLGHTADITLRAAGTGGGVLSLVEFAAGQLLLLGPVALGVAWHAGRAGGRSQADQEGAAAGRRFSLAFVWPLLAIGLVQAFRAKAQINWTAPALIGACLWLALYIAPRLPAARTAWKAAAAGAALAAVLAWAGPAQVAWRGLDNGPVPKADMYLRMRGWEGALKQLQPWLERFPAVPLSANRRDLVAHASYVWRHQPRPVRAFPDAGSGAHHYTMFRPLAAPGAPLPEATLVVTMADWAPPPAAPYADWQALASARSGRISLTIWLARNPQTTR